LTYVDFVEELKRISWDFEEGFVDVRAKVNRDMMDLDGIKIKLIIGQITTVPYWVAEILADEDLIEFEMDKNLNVQTLSEFSHRESKERKLVELNSPLFIRRVQKVIEALESQHTVMSMRKLSAIKGSFNKIMRHRRKKILEYAITGEQESKIRLLLSAEEEWLFNRLNELLTKWPETVGLSAIDDT
jgi:hypothetical protein